MIIKYKDPEYHALYSTVFIIIIFSNWFICVPSAQSVLMSVQYTCNGHLLFTKLVNIKVKVL